eukprot:COSAG02_NODE_34667_length_480_cov_1.081365_1_plen_31_part_01
MGMDEERRGVLEERPEGAQAGATVDAGPGPR